MYFGFIPMLFGVVEMRLTIYTDSISPHQIPVATNLIAFLGTDNLIYIYFKQLTEARKKLGWQEIPQKWMLFEPDNSQPCREALLHSDVLMTGERTGNVLNVYEQRELLGKYSIYMSERWFKPPYGLLRFLKPGFLKMGWRIARQIKMNPRFYYFPIGIHAAEDMARMIGLFSGDLRCLFRAPRLEFERQPCGRIGGSRRFRTDKMRMWGYFVAPSDESERTKHQGVKVLWVGRFLKLKHPEDVIRAVIKCREEYGLSIELDMYGQGEYILKYAAEYEGRGYIHILPPVSMPEVRALMRSHDVYVFSSNGYDGWGAVVSEALEEGMRVIGTTDAGSSATILPQSEQYPCGDVKRLTALLMAGKNQNAGIGPWSAENAAKSLYDFLLKEIR